MDDINNTGGVFMSEVIPVSNKIKVSVHKNCPDGFDGDVYREPPPCEYLVYLAVPKVGGDGLLLGVTETEEAAETIASAISLLFSTMHTHA
jgi:hypothetical protein